MRHPALLLAALLLACAADAEEDRVPGYTRCGADADCPGGQVCETDDTRDAYCTPTCTDHDQCPTQVSCPGLSPVTKVCYDEPGFEGIVRGECDQFQGYYGPSSCLEAPVDGGEGGGDDAECSFDSECSSSCSECPGCRSGSCVCGYRGVSGACIY